MLTLKGKGVSPGIAIGPAIALDEAINGGLKDKEFLLIADQITLDKITWQGPDLLRGIILEKGTTVSHLAFLLRSMCIPAVFGIKGALMHIRNHEIVIINGTNGEVIINPTKAVMKKYREMQNKLVMHMPSQFSSEHDPVNTQDGRRINLWASVGNISDAKHAFENGAEGIGVFRTEFMHINQGLMPSQEDHYNTYRQVLELAKGKPVVIRVLDVGSDKTPKYLSMPDQINPALGLRGLRYCLQNPQIFENQLLAIYRASIHGDIRILLPMVSKIEEILYFKRLMKDCQSRTDVKRTNYDISLKVGAMIEVPAAVEIIDDLCEHLDFFSIGSNDLIQYVEAVDRLSSIVENDYDPYHPAIIRVIDRIARKAKQNDAFLGVCGETANNPLMVPFLIGIGVNELTIPWTSLRYIRSFIKRLDGAACEHLAKNLVKIGNSAEIRSSLEDSLISLTSKKRV